MAKMQLSWTNLADAGTLSGGSWETTLPLANLKDMRVGIVARTTSDATSSTRIDIDLGASPKVARLLGLLSHNCSVDATYKVSAGTSAGASDVYNGPTQDVWPTFYLPQDLEWEDDEAWAGTITAADAAQYPINLLHDCGENIRARYWRLQITDTSNAAGYVQAGRLWLGPLWSPQRSYQLGASLGFESKSEVEYSLGGVAYFDNRSPMRVFNFELSSMSDVEALGAVLELERLARSDREVIIIPDPADTQKRHRRDIRGRLRRADPLRQIAFADRGAGYLHAAGFEVEELL